jgi:hypothetical protein
MTRHRPFLTPLALTPMTGHVMILFALGLGLCNSIALSQPALSPEDKRAQFLREANANRLKRTTALTQMGESHLKEELRRESLEGIAPVNSSAYKEVIRRGPSFAPLLASLLISTPPDQSSLLGLLALRKSNPTVYRNLSPTFRVRVLVDALTHAKSFNAWGLPNLHWHEAAEALIEEKDAARPALVALLQKTDSRDAPVLGLGLDKIHEKYHYRVSDYALALLNEINGQRIKLDENPAIRNKFINELAEQNGFPKGASPSDHMAPAPPHGVILEGHPIQ